MRWTCTEILRDGHPSEPIALEAERRIGNPDIAARCVAEMLHHWYGNGESGRLIEVRLADGRAWRYRVTLRSQWRCEAMP